LLPAAATRNQAHVIGGIDAAIAAGNTLPSQFENLANDSSAGLAADATQLAGEIGGDIPQANKTLFTPFLNAIFDHLGDAQSDAANSQSRHKAEIWISAFGGTDDVAGKPDPSGSHEFKSNVAGIVGGANWMLTPNFTLGAAVSAGYSNFHLVGDVGTGKANTLQGAVYGLVRFSPHFYGSFAAALARDSITTDRVLTISGTDDLRGKLSALMYGGRYETGILLNWATLYAAIAGELSALPAYSETALSGASTFSLRYAARTTADGSLEVGVRQGIDVDFTPRWVLTSNGMLHLSDRLAWQHGFSGDSAASATFVALPSSEFTIYHAKAGNDSLLFSLGANLEFDGGFCLNAHLDSALSPRSQSYTGFAGLGYAW
jgi:outer membrane autotransporter protein